MKSIVQIFIISSIVLLASCEGVSPLVVEEQPEQSSPKQTVSNTDAPKEQQIDDEPTSPEQSPASKPTEPTSSEQSVASQSIEPKSNNELVEEKERPKEKPSIPQVSYEEAGQLIGEISKIVEEVFQYEFDHDVELGPGLGDAMIAYREDFFTEHQKEHLRTKGNEVPRYSCDSGCIFHYTCHPYADSSVSYIADYYEIVEQKDNRLVIDVNQYEMMSEHLMEDILRIEFMYEDNRWKLHQEFYYIP